MIAFAKNFVLAFLGFLALACVICTVAIGPIALMISMGVQPFPYGLPAVIGLYCVFVALIAAVMQVSQP